MIEDLTIRELREVLGMIKPVSPSVLEVGKAYFVRTVTYHYVGRLRALSPEEIVLGEASWVADSGRWTHALTTGELSEVEPYPDDVVINRGSIVDVTAWRHELPREVK